MNKSEARACCRGLAESSPDRETHHWVPQEQADGRWSVIRLALPKPIAPKTVKTVSGDWEAGQEDPRTHLEKRLPPWSAGI